MITSGEAYTDGYSQQYRLSKIYDMNGYCPQFDALISELTCRQTLEVFFMVRGIPSKDVESYIESCARKLDLIQHIDKKVNQLRWAFSFDIDYNLHSFVEIKYI